MAGKSQDKSSEKRNRQLKLSEFAYLRKCSKIHWLTYETSMYYEFSFTYPSTIVDPSSSSLLAPPAPGGTQVLSAGGSCCCFGRPLPRPLPTPCGPGAVVAAGYLDGTGGLFDASLTRLAFEGWRGLPPPLSSLCILADGAVLRT